MTARAVYVAWPGLWFAAVRDARRTELECGAPRECAGRGCAGRRPAAPEVSPGVSRAAPGACPGAAKADVGDFGTSH